MRTVIVLAAKTAAEQLWPLVLTGTFALLGVWLGKASERRSSTEAWLRDQRLEAYGVMLELSHSFLHKAKRWDRHRDNSDYSDEVTELLAQLGRAGARIDLLGPEEVTDATKAYYLAHHLISSHVSGASATTSSLTDTGLVDSLDDAQKEFLAASQKALGR